MTATLQALIREVREHDARMTPGPWEWYNGCSAGFVYGPRAKIKWECVKGAQPNEEKAYSAERHGNPFGDDESAKACQSPSEVATAIRKLLEPAAGETT